jgi:hypothetical protein
MKYISILLFSIILLSTACSKKTTTDPDPTPPENMDNLEITSGFDWKTTKDFQLTVTAKTSNIVEVLSDEGKSYQSAFLTANLPHTMKVTVPTYETSVRLKYMGKDVSLDLGDGSLNYEFQ